MTHDLSWWNKNWQAFGHGNTKAQEVASAPYNGIPGQTSSAQVNVQEPPAPPPTPRQRSWCGLCGTYVYVGDNFPCAELPGGPPKEPCGVVGAKLEDVIPLSTEGVAELLGRTQGDPGDETDYGCSSEELQEIDPVDPGFFDAPWHTDMMVPPESLDEWLEENPLPVDIKAEIANEALSIVNGARRSAYGKPERNFERIAELWNTYLSLRFPSVMGEPSLVWLAPRDVTAMMRLMKEARLIETRDHKDSFTDIIGYALCQAEMEVRD